MNWKLTLMRVIVNGLVVWLVTAIVPGITVIEGGLTNSLLDVLIVGAVVGVLNAFVRPLVQFIFLPLVFFSWGLIIIVIDAVMLYVLSVVLPNVIRVERILAALLGGALMFIFTTVLEGVLGMTPPLLDDAAPPREERPLPPEITQMPVDEGEVVQ